mmetsp:Transcript_4099/g.9095  ORF Transcript_4099/g.9095 Transcript_4099/m.9095 type:complete len:800 (+) Transcript_4099:122-2521(+)
MATGRQSFFWFLFFGHSSFSSTTASFRRARAFTTVTLRYSNSRHHQLRHSAARHYFLHSSSSSSSAAAATTTTTTAKTSGMWDPDSQTYVDGVVPSHHSAMDMDELLALNGGKLKIFGYGSLCWHPGSDGALSLANIEEDEHEHDREAAGGNDGIAAASDGTTGTAKKGPKRKVTTAPGRAIGYQRCWSQRSADHRGTPEFNGIVCTLLSDEEVYEVHNNGRDGKKEDGIQQPSMTEGLIYTVDADLVEECLAELDFREKGGYARDVIDVVEDDTGNTVKALLYRGTPENPAFWKRVLLDLPLAAAIISVAIGPSGHNDVYLLHLDSFLTHAAEHSKSAASALEDHSGDFHTGELAGMVKLLQSKYRPYFLFGAGSNEHRQLLLNAEGGDNKSTIQNDVREVDELTEILLVVPRKDDNKGEDDNSHEPKSLHAGGGHSALLNNDGDLYLWGWNDAGQLGCAPSKTIQGEAASSLNPIQPLSNIKVAAVDLGHTHTLVIEQGTGHLFGFGENGRGQVSGCANDKETDDFHVPQTPIGLSEESFVDVAAGLFHSAAVTNQGELVTWGCGRFGQCFSPSKVDAQNDANPVSTVGKWRPVDGCKLVQVACGRRHTVALDEHGRVWTLGDNKYGQLGHSAGSDAEPQLVDGPLGKVNSGCFAICSGWSHILALTRDKDSGEVNVYGWGRNDKGQLGMISSKTNINMPQMLNLSLNSSGGSISLQSACCGSECSHIIDTDGNLYSTGWNEHGNLAIGPKGKVEGDSSSSWMATSGVRVVAPPPSEVKRKLFAAGGAHMITMVTCH